jgi:class 3 adenylate cyclase
MPTTLKSHRVPNGRGLADAGASEFYSFLETLLPLVIFGIIPLVVLYSWFIGKVETGFSEGRSDLVRAMQSRASVFSRYSAPEEFLPRWFGAWVARGLPSFRGFLNLLESCHPGAVRGIAWDRSGRLLALPVPGLFGRKAWGRVVNRYFLSPRPSFALAGAVAGDQDARLLQEMLGKKIRIEQILSLRNEARKTVWLDSDCFLVQIAVDPQRLSADGIAGGLFFVFPDFFPPDLLGRLGLRMIDRLFADETTRTAVFRLVDATEMEGGQPASKGGMSGRTPSGLRGRNFRAPARFLRTAWWKQYRSRTEDVLQWGKWLILAIDQPLGCRWKAFLVADLSSLRLHAQKDASLIRGAWFFGSLWILFFAWIRATRWFRALGFRWRIAGYFSLSLVAPTILFLSLAVGLINVETARSRQAAFEKLKVTASLLQKRFDRRSIAYGKRLDSVMQSLRRRDPSPACFYAVLDRWVRHGIIADYYVANMQTVIRRINDPGRGTTGVPFMRTVLRNEIDDWKKEGLPEIFPDRSLSAMVFGTLRRTAFGNTQTTLGVIRLTESGENLLFMLEVSEDRLNRSFLRYWNSRRRTWNSSRNVSEKPVWEFYSPFLNRGRSMLLSKTMRHAQGFQGWSFPAAMQGEVEFEKSSCFFHVSSFRSSAPFRTVLFLSQEDYFRKSADRWSQISWLVSISLFSAFIFGVFLAGSLLRPILSLDRAVRELRKGCLSIVLPEEGTNEVGRLNRSFNEMTEGLRQRERMRSFVSASVLQAVTEERPSAGRFGEIRVVTVLFTHIHRFEELLRRFSPHEVFGMLNGFLAGAEPCIRRVGGEVDKFLGDALMAVFLDEGAEGAAVTAALALHEFVSRFNLERQEAGAFPIEIGIGINTGPVMMGDVGSSRRKDLTVIGDTVNVAARLETASSQGRKTRIILSDRTFTAVSHLIEAEEMEISQVKGKSERMRIFELVTTRRASIQ